MMYQTRIALLATALLLAPIAAAAQAEGGQPNVDGVPCPPPISTCADETETRPECPAGYRCTCVPSCPGCRDCPARVCVPGSEPECKTACDCAAGLGCFDGQCLAGFAPVFCCEGADCPVGQQCQHRDGRMDRCAAACVDQVWRCETPGGTDPACGAGRICSCTASCPLCENCGAGVCIPPGVPTPYRCNEDGSCERRGDRCACVSSCPQCDDCAMNVCVPACKDPMCDERREKVRHRIGAFVEHASACRHDDQCVRVDTSTECAPTCGAWVNRFFAPRLERFVDRLGRRYCSTYVEDGCPITTPRCAAQVGVCEDGRCVGAIPPALTDVE